MRRKICLSLLVLFLGYTQTGSLFSVEPIDSFEGLWSSNLNYIDDEQKPSLEYIYIKKLDEKTFLIIKTIGNDFIFRGYCEIDNNEIIMNDENGKLVFRVYPDGHLFISTLIDGVSEGFASIYSRVNNKELELKFLESLQRSFEGNSK